MKRTFTAPFWGIVILEILYISLALFAIYYVEMMRTRYPELAVGYHIMSFMIIKNLVWVGVLSGEAILYWRLRKRNICRRESWAHVLILTLVFVLPGLENVFIMLFGNVLKINGINKMRSAYYVEQGLYWALVLLAHVFFVRVLVKCFKKSVEAAEGAPATMNILDDIGID